MSVSVSKVTPLVREMYFVLSVITIGLFIICIVFEHPITLIEKHWFIFFIAIVAACIANATAVGGGFIFMPLFSFVYGMPSVESLKLALATQAFGMTSGAMAWSSKRIVMNILGFALLFSILGMIVGSILFIPDQGKINLTFGVVSILIALGLAIELYYAKPTKQEHRQPVPLKMASMDERLLFACLCFAGGLINAWVSIGIGEIVALWMLLKWRYSLTVAIATGVAALAGCSLIGLMIHSVLGGIPWDFLAFTAPGVVIGGRLGAFLGIKLSGESGLKSTPLQAKSKAEVGYKSYQGNTLKKLMIAVIFIDGFIVVMKTM